MKYQGRETKPLRQTIVVCAAVVCLGAMTICLAGCGRSDKPREKPPEDDHHASADPKLPPDTASDDRAAEKPVDQAAAQSAQSEQAARDLLARMVEVYQGATSYADQGKIRITGRLNGQNIDVPSDYMVAVQRPGKVRMQVNQGILVSDGQQTWAFLLSLANQVLHRPVAPEMSIETIFADHLVAAAMGQGPNQVYSWVPIQLILMMSNDPLEVLLQSVDDLRMDQPDMIGLNACYRVRGRHSGGEIVFWIDQGTHVLRRFEFPIEQLQRIVADGQVQNLALVAEFADANVNSQINEAAFKFEAPQGVDMVDTFLPPVLTILGKPAGDFSFVDLEGKPVTAQSLAGKVVVLDFWASWCEPCRKSLPLIEEVYQQFKDNDKVAFLAVSVDNFEDGPNGPKVEDAALTETFAELKVTIPIVRDPAREAGMKFGISNIPTSVLIGSNGEIQDWEAGVTAEIGTRLTEKLNSLLAGESLSQQKLDQYLVQSAERQKQFEGWLAKRVAENFLSGPISFDRPDRTQPTAFKLSRLWGCQELGQPGNIVVIPGHDDAGQKLLVLDRGASVAELSPDGKVTARYALPASEGQPVSYLRTAVGADGIRYYVGGAVGSQQIHLLDSSFQAVLSYPKDVVENPHQGIGDVQFSDLDADGKLELCVGFQGAEGLRSVTLDGSQAWDNRKLDYLLRLAVLGPGASEANRLLATHQFGTVAVFEPDGKFDREIRFAGLALYWIVAADLDGDSEPELCALSPNESGDFVALGVDLKGEILWSYALPQGIHQYPIEPVVAGQLFEEGPGQWLISASDGSIHVIAADGQLIDNFSYGMSLTGIATAKFDGRPVLLVSTPQFVDAWQVEKPGAAAE